MRLYELRGVKLPSAMSHAKELAFSRDTVSQVYKTDKIGSWQLKRGKPTRELKLEMDIPNIPKELTRFVCGKKLRSTICQTLEADTDDYVEITSRVRFHILGNEFLRVKPQLMIKRNVDMTEFQARVECHAVFPPPLNAIAEAFMVKKAEQDILGYVDVIKKKQLLSFENKEIDTK